MTATSSKYWLHTLHTGALAAALTLPATAANPTWLGRPFTKIIAQGDPIPGTPGATFGYIEHFTLRDGTLHIVAGESSTKVGLFRWRDGVLTKLVYTDTVAPTGGTFDIVHFTTDETEGALNFSAEVAFNRPGAINGFFEWRNGVITTVFDGVRAVDGKVLMGLGYPVRVGHDVAGGTLFTENGVLKNGIFRWDGSHLQTIVQSDDDLPGSLGGFTGTPGRFQISFDGHDVGFVASADPQGKGPYGMYRTSPEGLIKLVDGNDKGPGGKTFFQRNRPFTNTDLDGTNSFLGVTGRVVATGKGNSFYYAYPNAPGEILRYSDGTIDIPGGRFGDNNVMETVLLSVDPVSGAQTTLDDQLWQVQMIDGHGDDIAALAFLQTATGYDKPALYAAIGGSTPPPAAPVLPPPNFANGNVTLRFPSQSGKSYRVDFLPTLGGTTWSPKTELTGNGADLEFSESGGNGGFYRVTVLP